MAKIKTKRERVKFASDNVAGACPEGSEVESFLNSINQFD